MYIKMTEQKKIKKQKLKELVREIDIPKDIEVSVENNEIHVKSGNEEIKRRFPHILIERKEKKILVKAKGATKREKKQINPVVTHIKNMFRGLKEDFIYKLQVCSVHFPMNVSVQDNYVVVKNFLGEIKERKAKILEGADVKIEGEIITVSSANKENAGQTAANIEKIAVVKNKDRRVFQDGIFMVEKSGRKM